MNVWHDIQPCFLQGDSRKSGVFFQLLLPIFFLLIPGLMPAPVFGQSGLIINEMMASNTRTIADEDGDFEDWIELANTGTEAIDLADFGLSDNPASPFKWRLPAVTMAPGTFLLVWASGKDRTDPGSPLHTNYGISAGGEVLVLTRPDGMRIDSLPAVHLRPDISAGRSISTPLELRFFLQATPGLPNVSEAFLGILPDPEVTLIPSENQAVQLVCGHPDPEVSIHYRLDGDSPREGDPLYSDTLWITEWPDTRLMHIPTNPWEATLNGFGWLPPEEPLPAGQIARARAFRDGYIPSLPVTETLLPFQAEIPVLSLVIDSLALYGRDSGIYTPGVFYEENGWNWESPFGDPHANYFQRGPEWERPGHLTFYYPDGTRHDQHLGIRIHGGGSRALPQKSLRLYARGGYGLGEFPLDIFQDGQTGHRRLILRNSGQDGVFYATMLRDAVIHGILAPLRMETQAYLPSHLFINGEYWGIHNIRERYDDDYLTLKYGIPGDELDILENDLVVEAGDYTHYDALLTYLQSEDISDASVYQEVIRRMDPDNYMDHQIGHIFSANYDWPGNNLLYWRQRLPDYQPAAPYGRDGRWRWMFKDGDMGFGLWDGDGIQLDLLTQATAEQGPEWPNPDWSTFLFRQLLKNETFRNGFIIRFCDALNTLFLPSRTLDMIDRYAERIAGGMPLHIQRWGRPTSMGEWEMHLEQMRTFARERPEVQREQLSQFFQLSSVGEVRLDVSGMGHIRLNTIDVHPATAGVEEQPYPWTGQYFPDLPLRLEAVPAPGYRFAYWSGDASGSDPILEAFMQDGAQAVTAHFEADEVPVERLLHAWHFNQLPSGTLSSIPADSTALGGAVITYPGTGAGYLDRVNEGTQLNGWDNLPAGQALRVRNPADTRALELSIPTTQYRPTRLRYAATRTSNGARTQSLWYRLESAGEWLPLAEDIGIEETFAVYSFELDHLNGAAHNPQFALQIRFEGEEAGGASGNNRLDNILVLGEPLTNTIPASQEGNSLSALPNPQSGEGWLLLHLAREGHTRISLYNAIGQAVGMPLDAFMAAGSHQIAMNTGQLPPGWYLVRMEQEGQAPVLLTLLKTP